MIAAAVFRVVHSPFLDDGDLRWFVLDDARCEIVAKYSRWADADLDARQRNVRRWRAWNERARAASLKRLGAGAKL